MSGTRSFIIPKKRLGPGHGQTRTAIQSSTRTATWTGSMFEPCDVVDATGEGKYMGRDVRDHICWGTAGENERMCGYLC